VTALDTAARPRFRGWVHAGAVPLAAAGAVRLWDATAGADSGARASVMVFAVSLVLLFGVSALYHVPRWDARRRWLLSRADVAMIQIFIAASFTPLAWHALDGVWRTGSLVAAWSIGLVAAWSIGLVGAVVAASPITGPRWLVSGAYLAFGWSALVPIWKIAQTLPWPGVVLIGVAGGLYTVGACVYATKRPDPWPHRFGFHEVFHTLVVLAGAIQFVALARYVLPLA